MGPVPSVKGLQSLIFPEQEGSCGQRAVSGPAVHLLLPATMLGAAWRSLSSSLTPSQLTPGKPHALHASSYVLTIQSIISSSDPLVWLPQGPFHTTAPKNLQSHHTPNECPAPSPKFPHLLGSSGSCCILWGPATSSGVMPHQHPLGSCLIL